MQEIIKIGQMKGFESENRVYDPQGICPCIKIGGDPPKVIEINVLGGNMPVKEKHGTVTGIVECRIVAMRGRDPQNPSDRTPGNPNLEQRLEPNNEGISNTLTTVQKDNMVLEVKQATKEGSIPCVVGGGGGSELPGKQDKARKGARAREYMPYSDNGEYP